MTAVELLPPGCGPDDERWHELRRQGVTASEIAAVLGISPWESPFSLYWRKVNGWRTEENEFTSAGRHLEDAIAMWWNLEVGPGWPDFAMHRAGLYAHADRPWQLATPDRLIHGELRALALLECKWVAHRWDGWGEPGTDDIPVYYRAQCLWQLDVLGVDEVHVAALGPGGFRAYVVRRDEADLQMMRLAGAAFVRAMKAGQPPDLDGHAATLTTLRRLHPTVGEGDVEVPVDLAEAYRQARADKREADARVKACEARIRDALGSTYARATCGGKSVASRSVFDVKRIDVDQLRKELPEVAEQYLAKTTTDRLTPGKAESYA